MIEAKMVTEQEFIKHLPELSGMALDYTKRVSKGYSAAQILLGLRQAAKNGLAMLVFKDELKAFVWMDLFEYDGKPTLSIEAAYVAPGASGVYDAGFEAIFNLASEVGVKAVVLETFDGTRENAHYKKRLVKRGFVPYKHVYRRDLENGWEQQQQEQE